MSYIKLSEQGYILSEATQQAAVDQTMQAYRDALDEIDRLIEKHYAKLAGKDPEEYYQASLQYNRLTKLKAEITKVYRSAATAAGKSTQAGLESAMAENYNRQLYLTNWLAPDLSPVPINKNLVKYAVTGNVKYWEGIQKSMGDIRLYTPQTGTLKELLSKNAAQELDQILQAVTNGLITGQSYRDQAKTIRDIIGSYRKKKGLEEAAGAMYKALRIARTEGTRVMNAATIAQGKEAESQGIEIKKEWMATLDMRTRGTHSSMDGQRVGLDDDFVSPSGATGQAPGQMSSAADSINCRCTTMTVVDGESPEIRRARNPETGENEVISWRSFDEWKVKLTK